MTRLTRVTLKRSYRALFASAGAAGLLAGAGVAIAAVPHTHSTDTPQNAGLAKPAATATVTESALELQRLRAQLTAAGANKAELQRRIAALIAREKLAESSLSPTTPGETDSESAGPSVTPTPSVPSSSTAEENEQSETSDADDNAQSETPDADDNAADSSTPANDDPSDPPESHAPRSAPAEADSAEPSASRSGTDG